MRTSEQVWVVCCNRCGSFVRRATAEEQELKLALVKEWEPCPSCDGANMTPFAVMEIRRG